MLSVALVALGGALGAAARYSAGLLALRLFGTGFPVGTLLINILGSFLLGWLSAAGLERRLALTLGAGVLGGFTTFSAFSVEAVGLFGRSVPLAALYISLSTGLSILAAWAGLSMGRTT